MDNQTQLTIFAKLVDSMNSTMEYMGEEAWGEISYKLSEAEMAVVENMIRVLYDHVETTFKIAAEKAQEELGIVGKIPNEDELQEIREQEYAEDDRDYPPFDNTGPWKEYTAFFGYKFTRSELDTLGMDKLQRLSNTGQDGLLFNVKPEYTTDSMVLGPYHMCFACMGSGLTEEHMKAKLPWREAECHINKKKEKKKLIDQITNAVNTLGFEIDEERLGWHIIDHDTY
jgi:hypothetical protein